MPVEIIDTVPISLHIQKPALKLQGGQPGARGFRAIRPECDQLQDRTHIQDRRLHLHRILIRMPVQPGLVQDLDQAGVTVIGIGHRAHLPGRHLQLPSAGLTTPQSGLQLPFGKADQTWRL